MINTTYYQLGPEKRGEAASPFRLAALSPPIILDDTARAYSGRNE